MKIYKTCLVVPMLFTVSSTTFAQFESPILFQILPGSEYTYLPSPESPGIPGCDPNDFQCDFEITGFFTLEILPTALPTARIVNADLTLFGNESVAGPGLTTVESVENWLESQELVLTVSIPEATAFQSTTLPGIADPFIISYDLRGFGNHGRMDGGTNFTPSDGNGVDFRVNLLRIPEPASAFLLLIGGGGFIANRRCR